VADQVNAPLGLPSRRLDGFDQTLADEKIRALRI
jgi:hypothetical protein